ncbi:MAG: MFS transporter [Planctomycetes bacterium]|nr:MFS transporter [Planctomycetota bacterium]
MASWSDAWRERNYRWYAGGMLSGGFGLQMLNTAVLWDVWERSHSPMSLGLIGLARALPVMVLAFPAGHMVDLFDRKKILVFTQSGFAAVAALLAFASYFSAPLWISFVAIALSGCVRAFNMSTRQSLLPLLVPIDRFQNAVTWNSAIFQCAAIGGPILAGKLIVQAHSTWVVFALSTVLCGGFAVASARLRPRETIKAAGGFGFRSMFAGAAHIRKEKVILGAILLDLLAVLFGGATALLPIFATDILQTDAVGFGLLKASTAIGALIIAGILAVRPTLRPAGPLLLWSVAAFGVCMILFGISRSLWLSVALLMISGAVDNISVVIRHVLVQTRTPDQLRGRVTAVNGIFIECSNELGGFESGLVAAWLGPVWSVITGGFGTLAVTGAIAWCLPSLRKLDRLIEELKPTDGPDAGDSGEVERVPAASTPVLLK